MLQQLIIKVVLQPPSSPNLYNWDLGEILRYKEANSFTYVGNRIKWIDTFEMLKIFTKNAIGYEGKWISPGGKYKKFVSSNSDLTITWNHELGMLTFKGNVGDNLKELFINIYSMNEDKPTNSINFEPGPSNKDKLLRVDQIVSEADGKVIDRDSVECSNGRYCSELAGEYWRYKIPRVKIFSVYRLSLL